MHLLRAVLALMSAIFLCAAPGAAQQARPPLDRARVAAFVDGAVAQAMRTQHIQGVSVAIVDAQGVVLTRGYGLYAPGQAEDDATLVRVASISKTPTWIAIMQLVEQGKLTLDDPINDHLPPDLRIPDEGFSQPILVRHLLTHSAGFEDSALGHLFVGDASRLSSLTDYLRRYRPHRVRAPGVLSVYSNYGAALAGAIVEHESGQLWQDYAEQHIFRPLGMTSATYREPYSDAIAQQHHLAAPMAPELAARVSSGFLWSQAAFRQMPWEYAGQIAPAGSLSVNARDMALYMQALLDPRILERAGVLRAATALEMREPLRSNLPNFGPNRHGFLDSTAARPLMGFGHDGDLIYQHSLMSLIPDLGLGVFISVNTPTGTPLRATLLNDILKEFYGIERPPITRVADPRAESTKYAGEYRGLRRPFFRTERAVFSLIPSVYTVADNGDLIAQAGPFSRRFAPVGDGVFEYVDGPAQIRFAQADDGRMRLYDPYSAGPAERVTYFESSNWLLIAVVFGALAALGFVRGATFHLMRRRADAASLAFGALGLLWLIAGGVTIAALLPWAGEDQGVVLLGYPGKLFPLGCWLLLIAAIATPLVMLAVAFPLRPKTWAWHRWSFAGLGCVLVLAMAATLWDRGFLGFSGF